MVYVEGCKESTGELFWCYFQQGHGMQNQDIKINHIVFMNNEHVETESERTISFTIVLKKIKYLGVNLIKHVQDIYAAMWKRLMKKIKDLNKWRHTMFRVGSLNLAKISFFPQFIHKFNTIAISIPTKTKKKKRHRQS